MRPLHIVFAVLVVTIWGGNFVAAKFALSHFPPFFFTALRFTCVALLLLPFVPVPGKKQMHDIAIIGLLNAMHFSLPYLGLALGLSIASTAITAQLGIPFSCLLGAIMMNDRLGPWRSAGMALAFFGMFIVFGAPNVLEHQAGFIATLAGAFFWGLCNILLKRVSGVQLFQMLAWMSVFTAPPVLLISFVFEPGAWQSLSDVPMPALLGLIYTVLASTLISHSLWYFLLQTYPITYVAPYSLMTPVFGALFALLIFGEQITWEIVIGGLITLIGVAIIVRRRPKLAALEPEPV